MKIIKPKQHIFQLLLRLWGHLGHRRQWQFSILLILMVFTSFAEILSIGTVLPFLGVLTEPARIFELPTAQPIIKYFNLSGPDQLLLPVTIIFSFAVLMAGMMRLLLLWASTRLSYATGADISISTYRRTLYQPYAVHVARSSSEIMNGILNKTGSVISAITMCTGFIGSAILLVAILTALLLVEPFIAVIAFGGFGFIYMVIIWLTRKKLSLNSQYIAHESTQLIKSLQEGLGGIRDVLINGSQPTYCQIYHKSDIALRRAQGSNDFISGSPRFGIEALGMILIAVLAYTLVQQSDGITKTIPILGALALGAQRLLPVLQQAYAAWSGIHGLQASLQDTLDLLDQPLPDFAYGSVENAMPFKKYINLKHISFCYNQNEPMVLNDVSLKISKGSRVGFIGTTGSGKSTLLDLLMGLLCPTKGTLEIDGYPLNLANIRAWQTHIAHVPQSIFLADISIEENIALGVPFDQIDHERVIKAALQAQISDVIESWPQQYQTIVGERGIRLSGGQRQRIGIARALYKQADIIIFDEATSALDSETEQAVMDAIESLDEDLTILIIAHRITTLKNCSQIIKLDSGRLQQCGTYDDMFE